MKTITVTELQKLLNAKPELILLDVRTPAEFSQVHVPQARNQPLERFDAKALIDGNVLFKNQPVYLLCHSSQRAVKAAEKLAAEGVEQPIVVEGGTQAWVAAGFTVVRREIKVISLERQVRIAAGALVFTGVILSKLIHPGFVWVSGFVGAGLVFAGITDFCGMGLLLAKMPWNQRS